jgi:hypothetical protein
MILCLAKEQESDEEQEYEHDMSKSTTIVILLDLGRQCGPRRRPKVLRRYRNGTVAAATKVFFTAADTH